MSFNSAIHYVVCAEASGATPASQKQHSLASTPAAAVEGKRSDRKGKLSVMLPLSVVRRKPSELCVMQVPLRVWMQALTLTRWTQVPKSPYLK